MAQRSPLLHVCPGSPAIPQRHHFVAFLQFGAKSLKSLVPVSYVRNPKSLAEHLLKRRTELKLRQKDVANMMGIDVFTYLTWEKGKVSNPEIRMWKHIIQFLGYDPQDEANNFAERLKAYRRRHGLSQKKIAKIINCDEGTLARWENGCAISYVEHHLTILRKMKLI